MSNVKIYNSCKNRIITPPLFQYYFFYSQVEKIPKIKKHLSDIKCCDGDSATFECEIHTEGDTSNVDFRWYKNGRVSFSIRFIQIRILFFILSVIFFISLHSTSFTSESNIFTALKSFLLNFYYVGIYFEGVFAPKKILLNANF